MAATDALTVSIQEMYRGRRQVLRDVSLAATPCSLHALLGPNGSGKSSLMRAMAGIHPARGSVVLAGRDLLSLRASERAELLAWVPQTPAVPEGVRVRHVVALGRALRGESAQTVRDQVARALARCGVEGLADRLFEELSAGERQRVVLARALVSDARVLLLDEPFAPLDLGASLAMEDLLRAIASEGAIIIVALHDLAQALRLASVVHVLTAGTLVASGAPRDTLDGEVLARVWGVRAEDPALTRFSLEARP